MFKPTLWERLKRKFSLLINRIQRVYSGAKLLWNNEDWDYGYALDLLKWKLERLEADVRVGYHVGCEKDARNIRICIELINRHEDILPPLMGLEQLLDEDTDLDDGVKIGLLKGNKKRKLSALIGLSQSKREHEWALLHKILQRQSRKWWT